MNNTDDTSAERRWHTGCIASLMLAQIACAVLASNASSDTNRDIFFAQQISSGSSFPLTGPAINGALHLGPLWYYLLAPIYWLVPNPAALVGFVVAIGTLQFPLAYRLAQRYATRREGILFVFALALPGFLDTQLGWLTHTTAIIPSLILGVFAAQHYCNRPDAKRALLLGVALTFMLTAHPSLALIGGCLTLWCGLRAPDRTARLRHALIVLGLLVLSLLPMLIEQSRLGFVDAPTTLTYMDNDWSAPSLSKGLGLIYAVLVNGPKYVTRFWLILSPSAMRPLMALYGLILVAAVIGLLLRVVRERRMRGLIGLLFALALTQAMFVCMIRGVQPPWMIFALWAILAALIALGLEWICRTGKPAQWMLATGLAVTTLWSISVWARFASGPPDLVEIKASAGKRGSYDVRDYEKAKREIPMGRIPYCQYLSIAQPLCQPVTLYGHYAYFVDISFAVGVMQACGNTSSVQFGGNSDPARVALLGLNEAVWQRIGLQPATRIGVLGIATPTSVWHSPVPLSPVVPLFTNYPRVLTGEVARFTVNGDAKADQAMMIAHRALRYGEFTVVFARADGRDVEPAWKDITTEVFVAPTRATNPQSVVHWEFRIEAKADYVDVVAFGGAATTVLP